MIMNGLFPIVRRTRRPLGENASAGEQRMAAEHKELTAKMEALTAENERLKTELNGNTVEPAMAPINRSGGRKGERK